MKHLLFIGEQLSKKEQAKISGGHTGGADWLLKCNINKSNGLTNCSPTSSSCVTQVLATYRCCLDACPPIGGHPR